MKRNYFLIGIVFILVFLFSCNTEKEYVFLPYTVNVTNTVNSSSTSNTCLNRSKLEMAFDGTLTETVRIPSILPNGTEDPFDVRYPKTSTGKILKELPYVDFYTSISDILRNNTSDTEDKLTVNKISDGKVRFTRCSGKGTGAYVEIDGKNQTMYFSDYDGFCTMDSAVSIIEMCTLSDYLHGLSEFSVQEKGKEILIDFSAYGIPLFVENEKVFIPITTFSSLFNLGGGLVTNGEKTLCCFC